MYEYEILGMGLEQGGKYNQTQVFQIIDFEVSLHDGKYIYRYIISILEISATH